MAKKDIKQPTLKYCKCDYCQDYFIIDKRTSKFCSQSCRTMFTRAKTGNKQPKIKNKRK